MSGANNELADFFQVLKDKGCFHDETQPVRDAFAEIEKKIINKVNDESYIQWIEKFVTDVLKSARRKVKCEEVVIEDIEPSRNISLSLDGKEYVIRTWNFHQIGTDVNGNTCAENVEYTLYEMVEGEDGVHGNEVDFGLIRITWINEEDLKMRGTVKWFNNQKCYGFIVDENGEDVFIHYSGLNMEGFKYLEEGQTVEFDIMNVEKGRQAFNVTVVESITENEGKED